MRVVDVTGTTYLDTFADNRPDVIAAFRKHAEWWRRYVRTPAGQRAYRKSAKGGPCFPVQVVIEPYDDPTN